MVLQGGIMFSLFFETASQQAIDSIYLEFQKAFDKIPPPKAPEGIRGHFRFFNGFENS